MKKLLLSLLMVMMTVSMWAYTYTKVTTAPSDWSGTYVVTTTVSDAVHYWTGIDAADCHAAATMSDAKIVDCPITITVAALAEGGYSVKVNGGDNDGKYISSGTTAPGYSNGLKFIESAHRVDFALDSKGCVQMSQTISGGKDDGKKMYFLYNATSSNNRFRFYKDSNLGGSNYPTPVLYKQDAGAGVSVTGVSLNNSSASINVGETVTLTATVAPSNADNKSVTWSSSDEDVATVSNGVVTGVAAGTATITVKTKDGNFTATCTVTVTAVGVTGISLDQTSCSIMEYETATLVATVTPDNAADKAVTWTSSDEAIATVAAGVVTGVAPGSATITATTVDGSFTATCAVTVLESPYILAYTFDFSVNNFGLPTSAVKNKEQSYTYDGKTIKLYGDASNGFKFSGDNTNGYYLIMGKKGAYLTLPAFDFPVGQIVVEGKSSASSSVVQNIFVGDKAVSTATTGAEGINNYEIANVYRPAGNVYTLKVTSSHNTQITAVKIYRAKTYTPSTATITLNAACNDGEFVYGTYSNEDAWVVPSDLEVSVVAVEDGALYVESFNTGDVVPANTGVMVSAMEGGNYTIELSSEAGVDPLEGAYENALHPSSEAMTGDNLFYRLTMHNGTQIGFWWGAEGGAAFTLAANKAYLAVPNTGARNGFWLGEEVNGLEAIETSAATTIYTLDGVKVNELQKGLNIVNGKKVMVK